MDSMETFTIQIDSELYRHYCDVCEKLGAEPSDIAEQFFHWCADHPREFQNWIHGERLELQMPGFP